VSSGERPAPPSRHHSSGVEPSRRSVDGHRSAKTATARSPPAIVRASGPGTGAPGTGALVSSGERPLQLPPPPPPPPAARPPPSTRMFLMQILMPPPPPPDARGNARRRGFKMAAAAAPQAVRAECNKRRRRRLGALPPQCRRPQISEDGDGSEPSRHRSGVRSGYRRTRVAASGERSIKQAPGPGRSGSFRTSLMLALAHS